MVVWKHDLTHTDSYKIINAVGNNTENLTKESVASQYVEKIINEVSDKT